VDGDHKRELANSYRGSEIGKIMTEVLIDTIAPEHLAELVAAQEAERLEQVQAREADLLRLEAEAAERAAMMTAETVPLPPREQVIKFYWYKNELLQICDFVDGDWDAVPEGAVEVPEPTNDVWNGTSWVPHPVTSEQVNIEREKRIVSGFIFNGKLLDFDASSKANISGAAQMAFMAIVAGAKAGNKRWNNGEQDFAWRTADDTFMPMDAQTVIALGQAAAGHEQRHRIASWVLKAMNPIPDDYMDDKYWS
jgi:hypothetical protein